MTYSYIYSYADFVNSTIINIGDIQLQVNALNLLSSSLLYINSGFNTEFNADIVEFVFSNELNTDDKNALDDYINNYVGVSPRIDIICTIKDEKPPGTNGGDFDKDIWITRTLNTIEGNVDFVSLSNNIITIKPGKYIITIKAPGCGIKNNQVRLYNITNDTFSLGMNAYSDKNMITYSEFHQMMIFEVETQLKVEHICSNTEKNVGFGRATGYNTSEIYTTVVIHQL